MQSSKPRSGSRSERRRHDPDPKGRIGEECAAVFPRRYHLRPGDADSTVIAGTGLNIAFYGLIFVLSLYFQKVNGWSPFATGLAFVPMMGMVLPANLVTASVSERLGAPQTIALACVITAAGCVALLPMASGTSYGTIGAQLMVLGGGLGLLVPSLTSTLLGSVQKSRSGIAAGVLNATRQTGSVLGVALFGSLVGGNNVFIAGAHASLLISAAVLLAGAIAIWLGRAKD